MYNWFGDYMSIIFLKAIYKYRLWGGNKLTEDYYLDAPLNTGEAWLISGHENGSTTILNNPFKGLTLSEFYKQNPSLFNNEEKETFPLLVKLIDANDNLSVQVHPDDKMAKRYNSLGKTECWYIVSALDNAEIIYGHKALNKEEFINKINNEEWDDLLIKKKVKAGDFVEIPAGMVHALNKGILVLEVQQSSDITFRLYDYDRVDKDGSKRELHLEEAIEATSFSQKNKSYQMVNKVVGSNVLTTLTDSKYFKVEKWELKETLTINNKKYSLIVFLEGEGTINGNFYQKGDACVVLSDESEIVIKPNKETLIIKSNSN